MNYQFFTKNIFLYAQNTKMTETKNPKIELNFLNFTLNSEKYILL